MRIKSNNSSGVKDMGYIAPNLEFNDDIPRVDYDIKLDIAYQDFCYDHIWYLDPFYTNSQDKIWAVRLRPNQSEGVKDMGYCIPKFEFNPEVPFHDYSIPKLIDMAYLDFRYDLYWYLSPDYNDDDADVWAFKLSPVEKTEGYKNMGYVSPMFSEDQIEYNPDLPKITYDIEKIVAPYHYFSYNLVYYVDPDYATGYNDIWAFKFKPKLALGDKHVEKYVKPKTDFDIVFISYNESNAEENWQRVQSRFPDAKRVHGVKGIFEAHKQAAKEATTDMFYVIDGDALITDDWTADYKPNVFDYNVVHLWTSRNPINDLEYGYGGVKLFPRQLLLDATTWRVDLTTGLGELKLIDQVSNITAFNTDPFNTWRSAFRECAKLASSDSEESMIRLETWINLGSDRQYGSYALHGAELGSKYGYENKDNIDQLKLINDYEWMKNEFTKFYK